MFCTKCGREILKDSVFCPSCGNPIKQNKEKPKEPAEIIITPKKKLSSKKWLLPTGIVLGAVLVILLGVAVIGASFNSNKRALKAYKEFYTKFYKENTGKLDGEGAQQYDCAGRIVMGPDGKYMMTILDITSVFDGADKENLYLYTYERGKVKKKAQVNNMQLDDTTIYVKTIDQNVYLMCSNYTEDNEFSSDHPESYCPLYILNKEDEFEKVKWQLKDGIKKNESDNFIEDYETEQGVSYERMINLFAGAWNPNHELWDPDEELFSNENYMISNSIILASGKDFEYVLEKLLEEKIKSQLDLELFYGKTIQKLNIREYSSEYPIVSIAETKYGFYGIRTSGNASLYSVKKNSTITDIAPLLKEVEGYKVTGIGAGAFSGCKKLENIAIPENITYIEDYAFYGCSALKSVKIPDSVRKLGYNVFAECKALEKVEVPDSVEEIGDLFGGNNTVIVFCNSGTVIHNYVEANNILHINGTIDSVDKAEVEKVKQIGMALKLYEERYQKEKEKNASNSFALTDDVSLIYLNGDETPECIIWIHDKSYYHSYGILLSYVEGSLIENEILISQVGLEGFKYKPKSGSFYTVYWANGAGNTYEIRKLTNTFEEVGTALDHEASIEENMCYVVNGKDVGSSTAVKEYINSLGMDNAITEEDLYDSVNTAYDALINK